MASFFSKLADMFSSSSENDKFPSTVESAVDDIMSDLSEYDRNRIANMNEDRLCVFHQDFGFYIINRLRLYTNVPLKQSCCELAGVSKVSTDQASYIILKELHNRIRQQDDKEFKI